MEEKHDEDVKHSHDHNHNPFSDLDEETQLKVQELQILDQSFQQLLMQKNAYSMEENEVDLVLSEVSKTDSEVMRIIGGQVIIKTTKDEVLNDMNRKKKLIQTRLVDLEKQEKEMTERVEELREEIMKKIN